MILHDIPPLDYDLATDSLPEMRPAIRTTLRSGEELLVIVTDAATWERQLAELPVDEFSAALREEMRGAGTHAR